MKKTFKRIALLLAVIITAIVCFAVSASAAQEGYYTYYTYSSGAEITDVDTTISGDITIPSTLGGYSVVSIGYDAFKECINLESVTIPEGVKSLGSSAFECCTNLKSVTIPEGVTSIEYDAFKECINLESVTIPEGVTSIGSEAFNGCTNLKSVTIPEGVTSIGSNAFECCESLENIEFPDTIEIIPSSVLNGCTRLKNVTIYDGVTKIESYAFQGCESLDSILIPESVTEIGKYAFDDHTMIMAFKGSYAIEWAKNNNHIYLMLNPDTAEENSIITKTVNTKISYSLNKLTRTLTVNCNGAMTNFEYDGEGAPWLEYCNYIRHIVVSEGCTSIGKSAFADLYYATDVSLPKGLKTIGANAFIGCESLVDVTIPNTVTKINAAAFYGCLSLKTIKIPNSVTLIGYSAFEDCSSLESVTLSKNLKSIEYDTFNGCTSLKNIEIPSSVMYIDTDAFNGCTSLKSITIPKSTTAIYSYAFSGCTGLESVTISDGVEKIAENAFEKCTSLKSITLPSSVKYIFVGAFSGCKNLNEIVIFSTDCKFNGNCFNYSATIYGFKGSTAEKYAKDHDMFFVDVETVHTHTIVKTDAVAATCSKTGLTEGKKCSVCGKVTVAQQEIAKTAHTYKTTTTKATLSKEGKAVTKCTACDYVKSTKTIYIPKSATLSATKYLYDGKNKTPSLTIKDSKDNKLVKDKDYTVSVASERKAVGKYTVTIKFIGNYSGEAKRYFYILPNKTTKTAVTQNTTAIKVQWAKVTGATGYAVEIYDANNKKLNTKYTTALETTYNGLKTATVYKFKIVAYKTIDGEKMYSTAYTVVTTATAPAKPTLTATSTRGDFSLKWSNVSGETGYVIQYSEKKDSGFKKLTDTKANVVSYSKNATGGKTYYFRVKSYKKVGDSYVYSEYSDVKGIKIKPNYSVEISGSSATIYVGKTKQLKATTYPADKSVTWKSSDTSVATVSSAGKVTAKSAGTATITVSFKYSGKTYTDTYKITVKKPSVSLNKTSATIEKGTSLTLKATTTPADQSITWKSSNTSIATVSSSGKVTGKKAGTVKITASFSYGGKTYSKSCEVTVKNVSTEQANITKLVNYIKSSDKTNDNGNKIITKSTVSGNHRYIFTILYDQSADVVRFVAVTVNLDSVGIESAYAMTLNRKGTIADFEAVYIYNYYGDTIYSATTTDTINPSSYYDEYDVFDYWDIYTFPDSVDLEDALFQGVETSMSIWDGMVEDAIGVGLKGIGFKNYYDYD